MPRLATALKASASLRTDLPVRSRTRMPKALSLGMNAVTGTLPLASTPTADFGLAASTALTAAVRMSKALWLRSKPLLSAVSTATRDFVPSWWWWWLVAAALAAGAAGAALAAGAAAAGGGPGARGGPTATAAGR